MPKKRSRYARDALSDVRDFLTNERGWEETRRLNEARRFEEYVAERLEREYPDCEWTHHEHSRTTGRRPDHWGIRRIRQ